MVSRTAAAEFDVVSLSLTTYGLAGLPTELGKKVASALQVIEEAIDRYGPSHLALSFNGGKDCTALMHLVRAALYKHMTDCGDATGSSAPLVSLYIQYKKSFPEMDAFVERSIAHYDLELVKRGGPMKQGLQSFKESYPEIQGIFVGTRRDDPYGDKLQFFSPTDPDWPQFMRVNPILDWTFDDVWGFMRQAGVPYCCLYDQGYTSLGDVDSTTRNPALLKNGKYQPAWTLANGELERSGRSTPSGTAGSSSAASGIPIPIREARCAGTANGSCSPGSED
ncbi:FAD1 flavin adenine dinucleotide synthetase [Coemansia sp. RSA 376]|nr:FAD1 flavin adenine dinucleotide synthetase [Coemansia sp. S3946]KAJ2045333.1 FAD1 flavin adenine dinucleotide synthetase [Coemansia sp. S2]KAJ2046851.1 FAD1 flavin adenine dinucleotide synthetase [Coemansia sp. S16]KAJ2261959.1 FAD1 flavin adenine dinucleotide synthetase [Coemansia sp. RSA 376]KAJ2338574.1 FAD1 flavin adenine dinucleotide synthetase [Coemansia sp. RSA 2673]